MASFDTFDVPMEFQDEDKWVRNIFTKSQLVMVGIFAAIAIGQCAFLYSIGLFYLGLAFAEIILGGGIFVVMFKVPVEAYMLSGGYPISTLIRRIVFKKFLPGNKVLYIKNYEDSSKE